MRKQARTNNHMLIRCMAFSVALCMIIGNIHISALAKENELATSENEDTLSETLENGQNESNDDSQGNGKTEENIQEEQKPAPNEGTEGEKPIPSEGTEEKKPVPSEEAEEEKLVPSEETEGEKLAPDESTEKKESEIEEENGVSETVSGNSTETEEGTEGRAGARVRKYPGDNSFRQGICG